MTANRMELRAERERLIKAFERIAEVLGAVDFTTTTGDTSPAAALGRIAAAAEEVLGRPIPVAARPNTPCGAPSHNRFRCSLPAGHDGDHIAMTAPDQICDRWQQ